LKEDIAMFPTLHTRTPALVLAALLGGAALTVPTPARAQAITAERALLNRVAVAPGNASAAATQLRFAPALDERDQVDGERALLNRSRADEYPPVAPLVADQPGDVDGPYVARVKALLNRASL
jgi:hypothetical protein